MRKIFYAAAAVAAAVAACASGCKKSVNYNDYVSENRYNIFYYSGDETEVKIYCSDKEVPFNADGIKGQITGIIEIYAYFDKSYTNVEITSDNFSGGQMSYLTVKDCWYMSFSSQTFDCDSLTVTISTDADSQNLILLSVLTQGVMSGQSALGCVRDYAPSVFEDLTNNGIFEGEIFIRLLFDENCYFYVGVCNRAGKIKAFLVDGVSGKIIAEREYIA